MRMSLDSYNKMNTLLNMCFDANAIVDNLAYNLDYYYYNEIAQVVHYHVAHVMPEWADLVSDKMLELSARPIRQHIEQHDQDHKDLKEIFSILLSMFVNIRSYNQGLIESADMSGDDEVRIFAEEFLVRVSTYVKQAEEWVNAANVLSSSDMNIHIDDYTHFIKLE